MSVLARRILRHYIVQLQHGAADTSGSCSGSSAMGSTPLHCTCEIKHISVHSPADRALTLLTDTVITVYYAWQAHLLRGVHGDANANDVYLYL